MVDIVVTGVGPYGFSTAAPLRQVLLSFPVCGKPVTSWRGSMPNGMVLNSEFWGQDADMTILARRPRLWLIPAKAHAPNSDRSASYRVRRPNFGLGPGWKTWFWSKAPGAFRHLPAPMLNAKAYPTLGAAGAGWLRQRVDGVVPVAYGQVMEASERGGEAVLNVRGSSGHAIFAASHVVAATGYKTDVCRLAFLEGLFNEVRSIGKAPALKPHIESSVAGLPFAGFAGSPTFGPSMRFIYGARFAAARIARSLSRIAAKCVLVGDLTIHETA